MTLRKTPAARTNMDHIAHRKSTTYKHKAGVVNAFPSLRPFCTFFIFVWSILCFRSTNKESYQHKGNFDRHGDKGILLEIRYAPTRDTKANTKVNTSCQAQVAFNSRSSCRLSLLLLFCVFICEFCIAVN